MPSVMQLYMRCSTGAAVILQVFVALEVAGIFAASPAPASVSQPREFAFSGDPERNDLGQQEFGTALETGNVLLASRVVENFTTPSNPSGTSCCQWP